MLFQGVIKKNPCNLGELAVSLTFESETTEEVHKEGFSNVISIKPKEEADEIDLTTSDIGDFVNSHLKNKLGDVHYIKFTYELGDKDCEPQIVYNFILSF